MDLSYILHHLGEERESYQGAVNPPVFQTSNFAAPTVAALRSKIQHEYTSPFYTRGYNPTVAILRKKMAALEGTEDALLFSSGSAAIAAAVMSVVKAGDHVVCVKKPYGWTNFLLNTLLEKYGVTTTMVDGTVPDHYENAIRPETALFILESPNSMTFELQDIEAIALIAKAHKITTLIDNSYNSPLFQQPAALGIDIICHSATKYISGHSDVVAGVVCAGSERIMKIFKSEFMCLGANISPHDASELLKGIRTLPLRMERISQTASKVAYFLENHPKIARLNWPFANTHPQQELAKKQMLNCGGLMSIELKAEGFTEVERFCDHLQSFLMATSWGGYESLAFPVCAFAKTPEEFSMPLPWNLVRLYIGLEEPELLISDLEQALAAL